MRSEERTELRGTILDNRYRVDACIGVGGTGVVFEATRLADEAKVVLKTLRPKYVDHIDLIRRLRREAEVAERVAHPGIVPVYEVGRLSDGTPYVVMKRMYSESLARLLGRVERLSCEEVAVIAARVAAILHSVHAAGYVHRDIKPEHILLDRAPQGKLEVRLLDFGVCASNDAPLDEKNRERGRVFGTPAYVSPEQAAGEPHVDGRADLFGLGITLFEARTGVLPFPEHRATDLLRAILTRDAPPLSAYDRSVDPRLELLVSQLLERRTDQRLPSARALSRALAPMLRERAAIEAQLVARLDLVGVGEEGEDTLRRAALA